jgi:hypothetical protein
MVGDPHRGSGAGVSVDQSTSSVIRPARGRTLPPNATSRAPLRRQLVYRRVRGLSTGSISGGPHLTEWRAGIALSRRNLPCRWNVVHCPQRKLVMETPPTVHRCSVTRRDPFTAHSFKRRRANCFCGTSTERSDLKRFRDRAGRTPF